MAFETLQRPTGIDWGNADRSFGQVKFGDDSQLVVLFYTRPVFNAALSKEKGVRQYENQTWIKMHAPAEKLNIIDRPINDSDQNRFPRQWNMFLQNKSQIPDGTPIDLLFPNDPSVADNLRAFGVHTIQQCANLSAHAIDTIGMGANNWKNMAKAYLENANSGSAFLKLREEVAEKDQQIKLLNRQFSQLKTQYDEIVRRLGDPNAYSMQPKSEGHDIAADRVNANHPSKEIRAGVDHSRVIKKVNEEDFETKDVTGIDFGLKGD